MKREVAIVVLVGTMITAMVVGLCASAQAVNSYRVVMCGTLGGTDSWAEDVNDLGQVVGAMSDTAGVRHAFFWDPHGGLSILFGSESYANAINNHGEVVGQARDPAGPWNAFIWNKANGLRFIPGMNGANDINDLGHVVGQVSGGRAALWDSVNGTTRTVCNDINSVALGINNLDQVVGYGRTTLPANNMVAFVWQNGPYGGALTYLQNAGLGSVAEDINNDGRIVGTTGMAEGAGPIRGFLVDPWSYPRFFQDNSLLRGVNDSGWAVGFDSQGGFVYEPSGRNYYLSSLAPTSIVLAYAINSHGLIAATAGSLGNGTYPCLLIPVPEPSGLLVITSGMLGLGGVFWRKKR